MGPGTGNRGAKRPPGGPRWCAGPGGAGGGAMNPVEAEQLFTGRELVRLEAQLRTTLTTTRAAPAAVVRQLARDGLRLLSEVHRARRFIAHVTRLAQEQGLLRPSGPPPDSGT